MAMSVIGWIVLGVITALIASKFLEDRNEGLSFYITLGIVGAVAGGWLFSSFSSSGANGFSIWSQTLAVVGAAGLLLGWNAIKRPSAQTSGIRR